MNELEKIPFDKMQAEKNELNLLIKNGVNIEVERTISKKKKGFSGLIGRREIVNEKLKFTIKEPTLSTLDRISSEQIDLKIDESVMSSDDGIQQARIMAHDYSQKLAKILAISVLGQDYVHTIQSGSIVKYSFDDAKLAELTQLFYENIQPSRLLQYVILVNTMSNLGDFTNSIRLMSAARTTMPIRIEEKQQV